MRPKSDEKGSTLVLVAVMSAGLILMTGIAADVGMMLYRKTQMQAATDAAALAGASSLNDGTEAALDEAKLFAQHNGYPLQDGEVSMQGSSRVQVDIERPVSLLLAPLLELGNVAIGASSVAEFKAYYGLRPLAISDQAYLPFVDYVMRVGSAGGNIGMVKALDLSGGGTDTFERDLTYGSDTDVFAPSAIPTRAGSTNALTESAAAAILSMEPLAPPYAEVLLLATNPQAIAHYPRILTVGIAENFAPGEVDVAGFARFYLDGTSNGALLVRYIDRLNGPMHAGTTRRARLVE